jgi:hypothetical protein
MWVIKVVKENYFTNQREKYDYIVVSKNIKKYISSISDRLSAFSPLQFFKTIIGKIHAYNFLKNMKAFKSIHHK